MFNSVCKRCIGKVAENGQISRQLLVAFSRTSPAQQSHSRQLSVREIQRQSKGTFHEKGYILLVIPIATFCLGTWQVQRRKWKLGLIEALERKTAAPPVEFPLDLEELKDLEYRKVKLRGTFDHSKERYIGPRANLAGDEHRGGLVSTQGSSGYHVITPFTIADRDLTILVNRGWVPRNRVKPEQRMLGQVEGEVEIVGVVRETEKRQPFAPKNDGNKGVFFRRDIQTIAEQVETEPIWLDASRETTVKEGPLAGQTRVSLRNEHLSYVVTWYSLFAITTFMWYRRYMKPVV